MTASVVLHVSTFCVIFGAGVVTLCVVFYEVIRIQVAVVAYIRFCVCMRASEKGYLTWFLPLYLSGGKLTLFKFGREQYS